MQEVLADTKKQDNDVIDITQYLRIFTRRKWSIIVSIMVVVALGIVYILNATPIYQASAKIQADPVQPNASAQDNYVLNSMIFLFYETQYEIIQSRKVAETVVDKLNLVEKYKKELESNRKLENESESILNQLRGFIFTEDESIGNSLNDSDIRTILAKQIQAGLVVEGGTQSQIIHVSYQNANPALAADIVNAVSESYIEFGLESRLSQIKDTSKWLSEQLDDLRITLQQSEDRLREFQLNQNLIDTEQQERLANAQLQTLNSELVKAQTQLSESKELYEQVARLKNGNGDYRSLGPVLQSNTIRDLVREESTLIRKVQELSDRYGDKHPKMIAARLDLASATDNIKREAAKIVENIGKQYDAAKVQEQNVRNLMAETRQGLQSYQGNSFELTRLEREVENNRRIYESFLAKLLETDISGEYDASNIRVIDSAVTPTIPVKPRAMLIVFACIVIGSTIGVLIALYRELAGGVVRIPNQLEDAFALPALGITPFVKRSKSKIKPEMQYIADQRSTFSEAINTIRTGILFSNIDNPPQTTLVTSSNGSEGKTTLSINLAVALSQLDKTLLIELDLRKPAISKDLEIKNDSGLSDFLTGSKSTTEINSLTTAPNLSIITCGTVPNNPMELISSKRFALLLEQYKETYRYIVIDSPPTLPVSDSCVLAKSADAVLVAVKAEETKIRTVKETLSRLNKVKAPILGLILTQASTEKMSYYGDHYYQETYYGE
ncbi:polysaccharide biosynthesis tyrosine autokinase [Alteromonas sp. 1_MG-2023]|uniref:GumC family protein n=1 Tax=Alteromonas sp. 1_MG-2023 TaxID=3062669 RepID=UPI0026E219DB|nr:polysaccharide biosynthesis tyrosine autokinase [Alteromonas sp. 1_MG-2023]MDO6475427.1 polysaccharide biosynthesis tyrosine autokinase [Alteromonas sp. 1_MG-2023]